MTEKSYLQAQVERMTQLRETLKANTPSLTPDSRDKLLRPLHERIADVLKTLTPEEQEEGIQLQALCDRLQGKYRAKAQAGEVGSALRRLGWVRVRDWRDQSGFRTTWHPPKSF